MLMDLPPAPPVIERFANKNGYKNTIEHYFWFQKHGRPYKDFDKVYTTFKQDTDDFTYILDKNGDVRFATPEEFKELDIEIYL